MSRRVSGTVVCDSTKLGTVLQGIVDEWNVWAVEQGKEAVREVTKEAAKEVKKAGTYKDRTGKYRAAIASKTQQDQYGATGLVYARNHEYSLTHLLENGHKLWHSPTRARAFKHWKTGEEYASEALPLRVAQKLGG